jgi:hypothetical protein
MSLALWLTNVNRRVSASPSHTIASTLWIRLRCRSAACCASWNSLALSTAIAARRAMSSARTRSCSPYSFSGCDDAKVIAPKIRPRALSGTTIVDRIPSSRRSSKCSSSWALIRSVSSSMREITSGSPVLMTRADPSPSREGYRRRRSRAWAARLGSACATVS